MKVLDCEDLQTTILSISEMFGCKPENVRAFLSEKTIDSYYTDHDLGFSDDELFGWFKGHFGEPAKLDHVYWFHSTCTHPENTYEEGILPLGEALNPTWNFVLKVFKGTEHHSRLVKMREDGVDDFPYRLKTSDPFHGGPYAYLVKEVAFRPEETGNHDYLESSEIVEDICNGYKKRYGIQIHQYIIKSFKPCIVKFKSVKRLDMDCIKSAIYYIYQKLKNEALMKYTGFNAWGETIPKDDILKIEYYKIFQSRYKVERTISLSGIP